MNKKTIAIALSTALIGFGTPAVWADDKADHKIEAGAVGQYVNDAALTGKVKAALAANQITDAIEIEVETTRGVVLLEGEVDSGIEKVQAEKAAMSVDGVEGVMNKLEIASTSGMGEGSAIKQYIGDAAVTTKVKASLAADMITEATEISVETDRGVVKLTGQVDSYEEKLQASKVAYGIDGVKKVENELTLAPDADGKDKGAIGRYINDAAVTTKVKAALAADSVTEAIEINVETTRGVVLLSGVVDSEKEVKQATQVAMSIDGVRDVMNRLSVN